MMPPGYTFEKENDSDSDLDAVAMRKVEKEASKVRLAKQEAKEQAAQQKVAQKMAQFIESEQVLKAVCSESERTQVMELLSSAGRLRPEADADAAFEARVQSAGELREMAKEFFQKTENAQAVLHWLGAVHHLDFTRNQFAKRTAQERQQVENIMAPVLSNLSLALRKRGDPSLACRASDLGLDYARGIFGQVSLAEKKPLLIKLYLRRALAKGELRNFDGALDDAQHALQLSPEDEDAKCVYWNAQHAVRRSKNPTGPRWTRPLDAPIPQKAAKSGAGIYLTAATVIIGPLLAYYFGKVLM